ncbi:MAG: hypothetical protein A4E54_01559 [Pelotomaculum sp. PtaB.Bin117]|nr:MAG: hypothetical protein A4E54_01559 [Pelotomaculum sp. PtaB.Bin117]OPY61239.1 MAG: hypothetical protein A4E56_02183 [Pelotomaculum sp. PtaU1.Bin065]
MLEHIYLAHFLTLSHNLKKIKKNANISAYESYNHRGVRPVVIKRSLVISLYFYILDAAATEAHTEDQQDQN